jgi:hypothetical protein
MQSLAVLRDTQGSISLHVLFQRIFAFRLIGLGLKLRINIQHPVFFVNINIQIMVCGYGLLVMQDFPPCLPS